VVAAVVLKEKQPLISDEILIAFCKEKLASYKCPKKIIFLDELPRNALGKIQKHLIVDLF
jgi:malonyl-CoA/methylmalonyl-CoA synthetase